MGRSSTFAQACIPLFLMQAGVGAYAQVQTERFDAPSFRGVRIDVCRNWLENCGPPAADLFCREKRYERAVDFGVAPNLGKTLVFGDGRLCEAPQCTGFDYIVCARAAPRQQQPPGDMQIMVPTQPAPAQPPAVAAPPSIMVPPQAQPPPIPLPLPTTPIQPAQPPPKVLPLPQTPVVTQPPPVSAPPANIAVPIPRPRPEPGQPVQPVQLEPPAATVTTVAVEPLPEPPPVPAEPPAIKFQPLSPERIAGLTLGEIWLVDPAVEPDYYGDVANPRAGQIPVWDDETVFEWRPSNPNMADYFELRFYNAREAGNPVGSLKVDGNQTYTRPDIEFLAEALENIGVRPGPQEDIWSLLARLSGAKSGNIFWEVAGYRGYDASGVAADAQPEAAAEPQGEDATVDEGADAQPETFDAEIAVSERWPLRITDRPNGFAACGRGEGQPTEFNINDIQFSNRTAFVENRPSLHYTGDEIELSGQISLTNSPYASHPQNLTGEHPGGNYIDINIDSYRFDNLFVDWGDGEVEPLTLEALDHGQYGRGSLLGLPPLRHTYRRAGSFIMRIFQVSEADVQKVHVADLSFAHQLSARQQLSGGAGAGRPSLATGPIGYHEALFIDQAGPGGIDLSQPLEAANIQILQGGFPLEVAERAYVVYCWPVTLTEPKDETAFGPLKLYAVDVEFDPTHVLDPANPVEARVSACDQSAQARARLTYVGKGKVTETWKIDGTVIGGVEEHEVGPSPPRTGIEMKEGAEPRKGTWLSGWRSLKVFEAMVGAGHEVTVEIKVSGRRIAVIRLPRLIRPSREAQEGAPPTVKLSTLRLLDPVRPENPPPVDELVSEPHMLTVVESDQTKPCHMRFLVSDGAFDIYLPDPDQVSETSENVFAGTGNLIANFADREGAFSVPLSFEGWQLENGTDVVSGTLAVDGIADAEANVSGIDVTLTGLAGEAGASDGAVEATIDATAAGGALRNADGSEKAPAWSGERARLAADGNWYRDAAKTGITRSLIGWSGFSVEADAVALDFSAREGDGPNNLCGGAGADWTGVRLDDATVEPNLLDLAVLRIPVFGWVIGNVNGGNGLCGDLISVNPVDRQPVGEGHISIKHIAATVRAGFVKSANYTMEVEVPLLGVTLAGTGTLMETAAGQAADWEFPGLSGPPTDLDLGPLRLQASAYQFGSDSTGWRVNALTVLSLAAEGKPFATVDAGYTRFGMNGRIHFDDDGATSRAITLPGSSKLGESSVDLNSATLTGPISGAGRLDIKVATKMYLSEKLEAPDVDVAYFVEKNGDTVTASGPATTPFPLNIQFPPGDPAMTAEIYPHYVGESSAAQKSNVPGKPVRYASLADPLADGAPAAGLQLAQAQGQASGIKFYADTNNAAVRMFGGTGPIESAFVLGYAGGSDYWMTLTNYDLGPSGTPMIPPIINLFKVGGGLGYHVNTDMFVGLGDVRSIAADTGKGVTFLAGMTAGTVDHLTFTMDGQLKMTETEKVRLDFTSWLLKQRSGSTGDFSGFIEHGGGSFDGQLWGGLSILEGAVKLSADKGAVDVHFGKGGPWHIYLGRREGPKIEVTLLNLGGTSGYMMLSGEGYFVGSGADINLGGKVGPFRASVRGWLEAELGIEPLKPRVSGSGSGGLRVEGCAFGLCVGPKVSVSVKMAALPVDVSARACFKVDLKIREVGACGTVRL